jgi:hypothetical protein
MNIKTGFQQNNHFVTKGLRISLTFSLSARYRSFATVVASSVASIVTGT